MRTNIVVVVVLAASQLGLAAQSRPLAPPPDISGTWVLVDPKDAKHLQLGVQFTVSQTATTVTVKSGTDREPETYKIDDSEQKSESRSATGTPIRHFTRSRFVGAALVITMRTDAGAIGHWEDVLVVSHDAPGHLTVVSINAAKAMYNGMHTRVHKYERK